MTAKKKPTTQERIGKVLRVNTYSVTHAITPIKTPKMPKIPALAGSTVNDLFTRGIYRVGDGDTIQPPRPGSLDHLNFKSLGNRT
jgi:hypothetical protein